MTHVLQLERLTKADGGQRRKEPGLASGERMVPALTLLVTRRPELKRAILNDTEEVYETSVRASDWFLMLL